MKILFSSNNREGYERKPKIVIENENPIGHTHKHIQVYTSKQSDTVLRNKKEENAI